MRTSRRVESLRESPTRKIDSLRERLVREGRDVILLSTGQPSIPPPREFREFLASALGEESMRLYGYTPSMGIARLREAISRDLYELGGITVEPDNIVVTAGGQEAMFSALATVLEEGDEVILMDPTYFGYKPLIEYFGARPVYVETEFEEEYNPNVDALLEAVSSRTKAIVVVTPDNPTGRLIRPEVGKALSDVARDKGLWLIVDEAYKTLIYEGEHYWFWRDAPENVIGIDTFSKDPGIPGWRLGYVYAPRDIAPKIKLVSEEVVYCPPSFAQYAVLHYLESDLRRKHMPRVIEEYRKRRDVLVDAVRRALPWTRLHVPKGSMFVFVDFGVDGEKLSEELLDRAGVATVPGSYFSNGKYNTFLRLSFVTEPPERLVEAVNRIAQILR